MTRGRALTGGVLGLRIAYGLALLVAPERVGRPWLGDDMRRGAAQVALRGLGGREALLHGAALLMLAQGRPVRGWIAASIGCDLTDFVATALARADLPRAATTKTAAAAGGAAACSGVLLKVLGREG